MATVTLESLRATAQYEPSWDEYWLRVAQIALAWERKRRA